MLKIFPSDKTNVTKNTLSLLSEAPTHNSFTFNSRFLYELKLKVHLCERVCGIFLSQCCLIFISSLYFCLSKRVDTLAFKHHNSFQN